MTRMNQWPAEKRLFCSPCHDHPTNIIDRHAAPRVNITNGFVKRPQKALLVAWAQFRVRAAGILLNCRLGALSIWPLKMKFVIFKLKHDIANDSELPLVKAETEALAGVLTSEIANLADLFFEL